MPPPEGHRQVLERIVIPVAMLDRFPDLRLSRSYAWEPVEAVQLRRPKMLVVDLGAARVVSTGEDRARRPGDSLRTDLD